MAAKVAAQAFFGPASTGVVPETISGARLQEANALLKLSEGAASIVGPALAGVLVHRRERVVERQDRAVREQGAREAHALLLPGDRVVHPGVAGMRAQILHRLTDRGGVRIGDQRDVVAPGERTVDGVADALVGLCAGDDEVPDAALRQDVLEVGDGEVEQSPGGGVAHGGGQVNGAIGVAEVEAAVGRQLGIDDPERAG